jgi:ketosteroid isomerase-like protein
MTKCSSYCTAAVFAGLICGEAAYASAPLAMSADECAVWKREMSFALSIDNHDAAAFAAHLHAGTVFGAASAETVHGRDAVVKDWANIIEGKNFTLRWRPHYVSIAGNPNIAVSRGPFVVEDKGGKAKDKYIVGQFGSVWVRENAQAPWLVLFDGIGTPPRPVKDAAEMNAYMDQAPSDCAAKAP